MPILNFDFCRGGSVCDYIDTADVAMTLLIAKGSGRQEATQRRHVRPRR
jgi:hypothetical protein